jgi:hypothetical protein
LFRKIVLKDTCVKKTKKNIEGFFSSLIPEQQERLETGKWVQVLGEITVDCNGGPVIEAHIVRGFGGVDPVRYHEAVRLQAEACPLNVSRKRKISSDTGQ